VATLLLLLLVNAPQVSDLIRAAYTEYPTWGLAAVAIALVVAGPGRWAPIGVAGLLGACLVLRTNQVVGVLLVMAVSTAWAVRRDRRVALLGLGLFVVISLLPLLHNVIYGGHPVLFTSSASINRMPLNDLFHLASRDAGGIRARQQLRGILYLHPTYSYIGPRRYDLGPAGSSFWLQIAIHGLQILWLAAGVKIGLRWRKTPAKAKLLMLLPVAYLAPHVVYDALVAYPRHIVVAYVAMGLVALYALTSREAVPSPAREPIEPSLRSSVPAVG
jgi:hypothetical protein